MKNLVMVFVLVLAAMLIINCSRTPVEQEQTGVSDSLAVDTDSFHGVSAEEYDRLYDMYDSVVSLKDSLNEALFVANYKLKRIQYYIDVVNNNSSQSTYLKGWVQRVLDD